MSVMFRVKPGIQMAELTPRDRLQPCLLDRLTDDYPNEKTESRQRRVVSLQQYKRAVLRDIEMLLNTKMFPAHDSIYEFDKAASSVLNYGVLDICGRSLSEIKRQNFERYVKQALLDFEPRIDKKSLSVQLLVPDDKMGVRSVALEIQGELWAHPLPDRLYIMTEVDLENGHYSMKGEIVG